MGVVDREKLQGADESIPNKGMRRLTRDLRFVWTIIGICILVVALWFVLRSLSSAIVSIVLSALIIFILKSPVNWMARKGVNRALATTVMMIVMLAVISGLVYSFVPMVADQLNGFVQSIPSYIQGAQDWWATFTSEHHEILNSDFVQTWISQMWTGFAGILSGIDEWGLSGVFNIGQSVTNVVIVTITALVIAFWILIDYEKATHEVHIIAGPKSEWYLILFSTILSRVLGGFIKGTLIAALCNAVIIWAIFMIIKMPFAIALSILFGLLTIIPYLGSIISAIIFTVLGLFVGPFAAIVALISSIFVPWIVHTFISPKIMSSTVNLHPGLTMVAIIAGSALGGAVGMVVGIPIFAFVRAVFIYFFESLTGRQLVTPDGALFKGDGGDFFDPVADATDGFLSGLELTQRIEEIEENIYSSKTESHSAAARRAKARKDAQAQNPISIEDLISTSPQPDKKSRREAAARRSVSGKTLRAKGSQADVESAADSKRESSDAESVRPAETASADVANADSETTDSKVDE